MLARVVPQYYTGLLALQTMERVLDTGGPYLGLFFSELDQRRRPVTDRDDVEVCPRKIISF